MEEDTGGVREGAAAAHIFDDDCSDADAEIEGQRRATEAESDVDETGRMAEEERLCEEDAHENQSGADACAAQDVCNYAKLCSLDAVHGATDVARNWLTRVRVDGPGAMAAVLCLVVDAARPEVNSRVPLVSPSMLLANDSARSVLDICESMADDTSDKTRFFVKKGHVVYAAFWRALVEESERATLHDTDCFEMLVRWLVEMSVASSRPLRLTACTAAYAIVNGLISVGLALRAKLETSRLQLETEKRKSRKKAGETAKAKKLKDDVYMFETDLVEVDDLKQKVFASILTLKYRDVCPEIRAASVVALVDWALRDTVIFLGDSHNKYAGWVLFDKTPYVRRIALESISRLFQGTKSPSSLDVFLSRFRDRIVAMSRDSDSDVCVAAVNLCTALVPLEAFVAKLNDGTRIKEAKQDNVDTICALTSSEKKEVRKAAGMFASAIVSLSSDGDEKPAAPQPVASSRSLTAERRGNPKKDDMTKLLAESGKRKSKSRLAETAATGMAMSVEKAKGDIREIIFTVLGDDAGDVSASGLVLEAVWEHLPAVHCWTAYCELLFEYNEASKTRKSVSTKSCEDEDHLGVNDMVSVAGLLLAAARQVSQGPLKRGRGKLIATEVCSEERALLTSSFLPALPKLMTSYRTDPVVLQMLAELPCLFDLSSCLKSGSRGDFKKLLVKLGDILARSTGSPNVLTAAAQTMKYLSVSDESLANEASVALRKEVTSAARALHAVVRTDAKKAHQIATGAAVLRSQVLSELVEVPKAVADDAVLLLRACCEQDWKSIDSTSSVNICHLVANSLMWESVGIVSCALPCQGGDVDEDAVERAVRSYCVRRDDVLHMYTRLLREDTAASIRVRHAAFNSICLVASVSVGVHTRLSTAIRQAESNSSHGGVMSRQIVDLMNVDLDEYQLSDGLALSFRAVIASHFLGRSEDRGLESSNSSVSWVEKEARDMLAGMCQIAFVGALPATALWLPLLGLLLKGKRGEPSHSSGVSGFDMAKLYYSRLKSMVPAYRVSLLEQQAIFQAARLDEDASSRGDYNNMRGVHALVSVFLREYSSSALGSKACDTLMTGLAATAFASQPGLVSEDTECPSHNKEKDEILCRRVVLVVGTVLAPRLTKATAESLLSMWENVDVKDHEEMQLSEFRHRLEAVSTGKTVPIAKRVKQSLICKNVQKRRRSVKGKKRAAGKRSEKRVVARAADSSTVRRSGRTHRVAYAEPDSEESDESDSESESSDAKANDILGNTTELASDRELRPVDVIDDEGDDMLSRPCQGRENVLRPAPILVSSPVATSKASKELPSPSTMREGPVETSILRSKRNISTKTSRPLRKRKVSKDALTPSKKPKVSKEPSTSTKEVETSEECFSPRLRRSLRASASKAADEVSSGSRVEARIAVATSRGNDVDSESPRELRLNKRTVSREEGGMPCQKAPKNFEENRSESSGAVRKSPRLSRVKSPVSAVELPAVKRSKRGRRW